MNLHLADWCELFRPDVLHFRGKRKKEKKKTKPQTPPPPEANLNPTKTAVGIPLFFF